MVFDRRDLEDEGGLEFFEDSSFPIHYSNQTYLSSPKPRKFKVGKKEFSSEMLLGWEPRKKTKVTRRFPN